MGWLSVSMAAVNNTAAELADHWKNNGLMPFEVLNCPRFVSSHESAVAGYVRCEAAAGSLDVLPGTTSDCRLGRRSCCRRHCRRLAASAWAKTVLDALDDRVKNISLIGGVNHGKAIDPTPVAAEHHLLIKDLAVALAG